MQENLSDQANQPLNEQNTQQVAQPEGLLSNTTNALPYQVAIRQTYVSQPVNKRALSLLAYNQSFKEKLCCPRVWTWVIFSFYIFAFLSSFAYSRGFFSFLIIINIVIYFLVAYYITLSSNIADVKKYKIAFIIFTTFFIIEAISYVILIIFLVKDELDGLQFTIVYFSTLVIASIIDPITLCILCTFKYKIDGEIVPGNQQAILPQQE